MAPCDDDDPFALPDPFKPPRDIFRRLNSHSRQHAPCQTLKSFGQIVKALFVSRYVDDLALRQAIEKQLNKVELANRLTRAVAVSNPRELTQAKRRSRRSRRPATG